jgi:hypothetical protein
MSDSLRNAARRASNTAADSSGSRADLLLRLSPGYPDVPPDMWWFNPAVRRADGRPIAATESQEAYFGRTWQRWSRHLNSGQWRAGVDSIESYLALVRKELELAARALAA